MVNHQASLQAAPFPEEGHPLVDPIGESAPSLQACWCPAARAGVRPSQTDQSWEWNDPLENRHGDHPRNDPDEQPEIDDQPFHRPYPVSLFCLRVVSSIRSTSNTTEPLTTIV